MANSREKRITIYHVLLGLFVVFSVWQSFYYQGEIKHLHSMYQGIIESDSNPVVKGLIGYEFLVQSYLKRYGSDDRVRASLKARRRNALEFFEEMGVRSELNPDGVSFRGSIGYGEATRRFLESHSRVLPGTEVVLGLIEMKSQRDER